MQNIILKASSFPTQMRNYNFKFDTFEIDDLEIMSDVISCYSKTQ